MIVIVFKHFVPKKFNGITLFPFILIKNKNDKNNEALITHEKIHIKQQLELLILPFYLWYSVEYLLLWFKYKNKSKAYYSISFEKEAYANENNCQYLKQRPFWNFLKYTAI